MNFDRVKVESRIREVLKDRNLVVWDSNFDQLCWLRVNLEDDGDANITFGDAPGNAYSPLPGELFIHVAVPCGGYDFSGDESLTDDEIEDYEREEDIARSEEFIEESIEDWLDLCEARAAES